MVFYYTSANIKILKNVWLDYEDAEETSPYEYVKQYVEKCPSSVDDLKLTWIAETFLGHHKHFPFLRELANHLSNELSEDDQDYFIIIFYAITFQLDPKDMQPLYKTLFNLSKQLLSTFTNFLSNNEVLPYISQVAQNHFDIAYVNDKIIAPLFLWQPYISEMAHNYAEYIMKLEKRKIKPLTVPVQPNVMSRKSKEQPQLPEPISVPLALHKNRKMLTKSTIDEKLKEIHETNKQNAASLLIAVKNTKNFHYARTNHDSKIRYNKPLCDQPLRSDKPRKVVSKSTIPVRENKATIQRLNQRMQMTEQEEVQWVKNVLSCYRNPSLIEDLFEKAREEKEQKRLYDIERKRLMGQISREEAILAKKKVEDHKKKKCQEFLKEKADWEVEIQQWKTIELERRRKAVEHKSLLDLSIVEAKKAVLEKNKETVAKLKKELEEKIEERIMIEQKRLEEKINLIKQMKILSMIAKKSNVPKIVDLTETSGVGLLCEMSMAELQERLFIMKIGIQDELQKRKDRIKEENEAAKQELTETKTNVNVFLKEREEMRQQAKKNQKSTVLDKKSIQELDNLKKVLEDKRKRRTSLETPV